MADGLFEEGLPIAVRAKAEDFQPVAEVLDHLKTTLTDGAGGTQYHNASALNRHSVGQGCIGHAALRKQGLSVLKACEKMGTGSGQSVKNIENIQSRPVPVPIFSLVSV
jgi:hypothetical protein